jgi:hypothetical protein
MVTIRNGMATSGNGAVKVELQVYRGSMTLPAVASGTWTFRIRSTVAGPWRFDAWLTSWSIGSAVATFVQGKTESRLVGSPACADGAVAVGCYTTKRTWVDINGTTRGYYYAVMNQVANYSAAGPRRDGALLPHVTAPGYGVAAALSSAYGASSTYKVRDGVHFISNGTSVAAAHVAGAVALMLEEAPEMTRAAVLDCLARDATADDYTGPTPNDRWGAGKLYLQPLVASAVGDNPWAERFRLAAWPNPTRGAARFQFNLDPAAMKGPSARVTLRVLDVGGRQVTAIQRVLAAGPAEIAWDGNNGDGAPAAPGLYLARLEVEGKHAVRKFIRLP